MAIRCIVMSNGDGSKEAVVFTEDAGADASDWCSRDMTVSSDTELDIADMPDGFPMEYVLERSL